MPTTSEADTCLLFLHAAPIPAWIRFPDGTFLWCNSAARREYGLAPGRTIEQMFGAETSALWESRGRSVLKRGKPEMFVTELPMRRAFVILFPVRVGSVKLLGGLAVYPPWLRAA